MALFNFKKKNAEDTENMTFIINDEEMSETEAGQTKTFDVENLETVEVEKTIAAPVIEEAVEVGKEEIKQEVETTDDLEELDDDDDYEYVTPHYGRNAIKLTLICIAVGMIATFILFKNQMSDQIKQAYIDSGYVQTTIGATATANDIKEGKTAYVMGQLVTGTYVELDTTMATATPQDMLQGYSAYSKGTKMVGVVPTYSGLTLIIPSTKDIKIGKGIFLPEGVVISGEGNLTSGNIKSGVKIFGITGTYK